ncbi:hypothetical protein T459_10671 [Capsicum annuum]|uniref:Uncharacterized protein n=1 Tax=Capsicum annuum TaxID=4072 RepID=A0A2G3A2V4_CAPAN|nr:hypothetical protein T459_10671 [Capsicum annuum]
MASINSLPIDGEGVCMLCKKTPSQEKIVTCITCVTPWPMDCLENPPVRLPSVVNFECPDCVGTGLEGVTVLPPTSAGGDLVAKIREIEVDTSMTEEEKARRRQEIVSGKQIRINENEEDEGKEKDVLSVLGESIKCPFCYMLPDRPVTVTVPVCRFHPTIFVDMDQLDNAKIHIGVLKQLEGNRKEKFNRRLVAEYSSMCLDTMERKECKEEEEGCENSWSHDCYSFWNNDFRVCSSMSSGTCNLQVRVCGHFTKSNLSNNQYGAAYQTHQHFEAFCLQEQAFGPSTKYIEFLADGSTVDASQEAIHYITDQAILGSLCIQHGRTCCRCVSLPPVIRLVSYWSALHMNSSL